MKKNYHRLGDWRRNVLLVAAAASLGLGLLPACSSDSGSDAEANQEEWGSGNEGSFSQGVVTEMTETEPGKWKITAERPAGKEEVAAIMRHYDGKVDTLQGAALQRQMQDYSRQHSENRVGGTSMMDVLMWSSIGYMAGRFLMPNAGYYANSGVMQQNGQWRQQVQNERQRGRGFFGRGFSGTAGRNGSGISPSTSVARSAVRSSGPRASRSSGFGSRSGSRGFGG
ncbi:hypothetical protein [Hymenobacter elongatus]|uniref:UPF0323 domain-containing protein n=1 Tax=Hymenobacter elongatus TaxID=877208 RepID=A0A4Z0PNW5_9BACT|nr:hypothetical protein [Hymenobacter elongatus]TGE18625.1 hypothetical protein E5J99_04790 [Hymenobacter elongatus]